MLRKTWPIIKKILSYASLLAIIALSGGIIYAETRTPSPDRDWSTDQAVLPTANIRGTKILIHNVRDFRYSTTSETEYVSHYYDATYDINDLTGMDFIVEPFSKIKGLAHTMFSFNFKGNRHLMVSVEIRKQKGDKYSTIKGLFNNYELMYVVGDERDLLGARAIGKNIQLYMYPVTADLSRIKQLFLVLMNKVNQAANTPEFYNSIFANCTTKLVDAVNVIAEPKIPLSWRYIAPGFSDKYAYDLKLIDTSIPFDELQRRHYISDLVKKFQNDPHFSEKIRK